MPGEYICLQCGYEWVPKLGKPGIPKYCPFCKSYEWDEKKENKIDGSYIFVDVNKDKDKNGIH